MITDIWTVMLKEWREFIAGASGSGGSGRGRGVVGVLLIVGIISIFFPLQLGRTLFTTPVPIIVDGLFLPYLILQSIVADSFAGERERHTLETLLASRLSDHAILLGKFGAAVAYGWAVGLIGALIQAVVANLSPKNASAGAGLSFYSANTAITIVVLGLLTSLLASSIGCLVSLRAANMRQAQLNMSFGFLVVAFVPVIIYKFLPSQMQTDIGAALNTTNATQASLIMVAILVLLNIVLLLISLALFQRARLILS
jgi:ABC-2 type transport system permease protein